MALTRWITACLFLTAASAFGQGVPSTSPASAKPSFRVLLSPGVAPCAIHVNAVQFPLAAGTVLTAHYDWNFGDPNGRFNALEGFTAAHVYDRAGDYQIALTVTDEAGQKQSAFAKVVISPDERQRFYISPEGVDENSGRSPEAPFRSLRPVYKALRSNSEVLFKANGTYEIAEPFKIERKDVVFDRYGDGADPILVNAAPKGGPTLAVQKGCDGVVIQHLTFDSQHPGDPNGEAPKIGVDGIAARGRNLLVRGCTFLNLDNGINANGSPQGMLVQDCKAPLATGLRAYMVWGQGQDLVYLGNFAANSTREHIVRMSDVDRILVAYNDFTNLDRRPEDKYDTSKGTIEMHRGSYAYIAHNTVADGTLRVGPLGLNEDPSTASEWVVIDSNTIKNTTIPIYPGSHHVMIRNNVIRTDKNQAIVISGKDHDERMSSDVTIVNNTAINNSDGGAFIKVWGHAQGIVLRNNLFVAPNIKPGANGTGAVNTAEDDLSSFAEISHNVWPAPVSFLKGTEDGVCIIGHTGYVNPKQWADDPQVKEDAFANVEVDENGAPSAGSPAEGHAIQSPGVCRDRDGKMRPPTGPITAGAMEIKQ